MNYKEQIRITLDKEVILFIKEKSSKENKTISIIINDSLKNYFKKEIFKRSHYV